MLKIDLWFLSKIFFCNDDSPMATAVWDVQLFMSNPILSTIFVPQKGPPRFLTEGSIFMTKSALAFVYYV